MLASIASFSRGLVVEKCDVLHSCSAQARSEIFWACSGHGVLREAQKACSTEVAEQFSGLVVVCKARGDVWVAERFCCGCGSPMFCALEGQTLGQPFGACTKWA